MRQKQALGQESGTSESLSRWSDKRIIFVSGKGGVGKSLIAASIAFEQANAGRRVLLAEIGDTSYYKDFWSLKAVGHDPVRLDLGFDLALWSGESCLREYVLFYLKMERLYKLFFENSVMRALVNVAPGLSEVAILGKITSGIRKVGPTLDYDLIVVDCFATGHALALFAAPAGMKEAIKFGPMGHHSREMDRVARDPELSAYVAVTLLEEMPVTETLEFCESMKALLGVETEIIANKVMDASVSEAELLKLENSNAEGVSEFAKYVRLISQRQAEFFSRLKSRVKHLSRVPLILSAEPKDLIEKTGEALRKA